MRLQRALCAAREAVNAALLLTPACFIAGLLWGPWLIDRLRELSFGKQIRLEGQEHHMAKQGTPTMGGWLFVLTPVVAMAVIVREPRVVLPLAGGMLAFAIFGALDDYANTKNREGLGLHVHVQILVQGILSVLVGAALYLISGIDTIEVPWVGALALGVLMVPFAALIVFATSTAANILDGLDGLAAGVVAIGLAAYMVIAYRSGDAALVGATAALIGGLLAFLWFNVHPAKFFMGDTGAMALGVTLGVVAMLTNTPFLLLPIGVIFVLESLSVIIQVASKKLRGKKVFLSAPVHHHFEAKGWPEEKVVMRFWMISAVGAIIGTVMAIVDFGILK
jgi:phospho-N-acetylmuramoyl-pentapeptide-transferase